jgi:hypothetical protein
MTDVVLRIQTMLGGAVADVSRFRREIAATQTTTWICARRGSSRPPTSSSRPRSRSSPRRRRSTSTAARSGRSARSRRRTRRAATSGRSPPSSRSTCNASCRRRSARPPPSPAGQAAHPLGRRNGTRPDSLEAPAAAPVSSAPECRRSPAPASSPAPWSAAPSTSASRPPRRRRPHRRTSPTPSKTPARRAAPAGARSRSTSGEEKATGFQRDEVSQTLSQLIRSTGSLTKARREEAVMANVARARNTDLGGALMLVLRAASGNVGSLKRLGLEIPKVTTYEDQLKQGAPDRKLRAREARQGARPGRDEDVGHARRHPEVRG